MKYLFTAIAFWVLGYIIPSFPIFLQYTIAVVLLLFLAVSLFYFIDTRVYARILHEQGEEGIPDRFL
jgi:hypothetical protein